MASPANTALYGHRSQVWLLNTASGSQALIDRVQSVEPSFNAPTNKYYQLGSKGPVGATQAPPEYRVVFDQLMVDSLEAEYILTGKNISPAGAQTYDAGDFIDSADALTAYVLNRNNADAILNELEISNCSVSEVSYRFAVNQALMQTFTLIGRGGKLYTAANTLHSWGTPDTSGVGGVDGKDARIWLASGSTATDRAYRLQAFTIRVAFPTTPVRELGNRNLVGTLADTPDVTVDFDILIGDDQPTEKLYTLQSTYYDYANPLTIATSYIRVFDPAAAEGTSVIKSFKLENLKATGHTPIRAQVRGLSTARYSATVAQETTVDSGGLIVSNRNQ